MTNNLKISIQGGNAAIGSVTQGNNNQVSTAISTSVIDNGYQMARTAITDLATELRLSNEQVKGAIDQLEELKQEAKVATPETKKGTSILKTIKENYSWAYPAIKDFLSIAWPALLALLV